MFKNNIFNLIDTFVLVINLIDLFITLGYG